MVEVNLGRAKRLVLIRDKPGDGKEKEDWINVDVRIVRNSE